VKGKRLKNAIREHMSEWKVRLLLSNWTMHVIWYNGQIDGGHENAAALSTPDWRYMEATLSFNLQKMALLDRKEVERVVVHELLHCLTSAAVKRVGSNHDELLVTSLALILVP
jgi:hypothetical protein